MGSGLGLPFFEPVGGAEIGADATPRLYGLKGVPRHLPPLGGIVGSGGGECKGEEEGKRQRWKGKRQKWEGKRKREEEGKRQRSKGKRQEWEGKRKRDGGGGRQKAKVERQKAKVGRQGEEGWGRRKARGKGQEARGKSGKARGKGEEKEAALCWPPSVLSVGGIRGGEPPSAPW